MKVKIFYGHPENVEKQFNEWAKGKALSRNIIIHTVAYPSPTDRASDFIAIVVYYPEWIEEQKEEKQ